MRINHIAPAGGVQELLGRSRIGREVVALAEKAGHEQLELGRFRGPLRDGPFSLKCNAGQERTRPVVTDWITI